MTREYYPEHLILSKPPDVIYLCPRCQAALVRDLRPYDAGFLCGKCGGDEPGIRYMRIAALPARFWLACDAPLPVSDQFHMDGEAQRTQSAKRPTTRRRRTKR